MKRLLCLALLLGGLGACGSQSWDNPRDPESDAYRAPCRGAPDDVAERCLFWDDFSEGLAHWHIRESDEEGRVEIVAASEPETEVLEIITCKDRNPALSVEIDRPDEMMEVVLWWRSAPEYDGGRPGLSGHGLRPSDPTRSLDGPYAKWKETRYFFRSEDLPERLELRLWNDDARDDCRSRLWIDRIYAESLE